MTAGMEEVLTKVRTFVETTYSGRFEVYSLGFKSASGQKILQIVIDGPQGITVHDCETVSRSVSRFLDEADPIHFRYTLEVSSPGAERLLKREVDFERHVGRMIRWVLKKEPNAEKEIFKGRLQEFTPERVVVISDSGLREFSLSRVEEARSILEFPRKGRG